MTCLPCVCSVNLQAFDHDRLRSQSKQFSGLVGVYRQSHTKIYMVFIQLRSPVGRSSVRCYGPNVTQGLRTLSSSSWTYHTQSPCSLLWDNLAHVIEIEWNPGASYQSEGVWGWWEVNDSHRHNLRHVWAETQACARGPSGHPPPFRGELRSCAITDKF